MTRGTTPIFPVLHMFPSCDLPLKRAYGSGKAMRQEQKSSRKYVHVKAFHRVSTGDVTNSLFHVSSNSPDVWWSLPDGISERLPLPPGRWQKIEVFPVLLSLSLSPTASCNPSLPCCRSLSVLLLSVLISELNPFLLHPIRLDPLPFSLFSSLSPSLSSHRSPLPSLLIALPFSLFSSLSPSLSSHRSPLPSLLIALPFPLFSSLSPSLSSHRSPLPSLLIALPFSLFSSLSPSLSSHRSPLLSLLIALPFSLFSSLSPSLSSHRSPLPSLLIALPFPLFSSLSPSLSSHRSPLPSLLIALPFPLFSSLSPSLSSHRSPLPSLLIALPFPLFSSLSPSLSSHRSPLPSLLIALPFPLFSSLFPSHQTQDMYYYTQDMYYYVLMPGAHRTLHTNEPLNQQQNDGWEDEGSRTTLSDPLPCPSLPSHHPQTQDMYYYVLMPGAQCTLHSNEPHNPPLNPQQKDGREDAGSKSSPSGPRGLTDEPITYFTAHSRLRSHLEAVGDSVLALTCVLHLVRQHPPLSIVLHSPFISCSPFSLPAFLSQTIPPWHLHLSQTLHPSALSFNASGEFPEGMSHSQTATSAEIISNVTLILSCFPPPPSPPPSCPRPPTPFSHSPTLSLFPPPTLQQVSNRSLAGIGRGALGLPGVMLSFSDALLMQGKRAVPKGGDTVEGLEAASAFMTRLLPSLVDSRTAAPHTQRLEFGRQYEQESGHQQQQIQPDRESNVKVGDAAAVRRVDSPAEQSDPVARLHDMSLQQLGLTPQYRHTGTDNPQTPHVTERVRVYAAGRRMGTGMGPTVAEAKRDGAAKALLAWGKVFGEGGSEGAGREASENAEERIK
ncbi:unnamed protein product [Closterium sp. NIES-65]|nr:unnamed protein product [Closterium sp. NIES-65]